MPHSREWPANHTQPHLVSVVGDNDLLVGGGCPHTPWSSYQQLHAINTKADIPFLYMTAFQLHFKYKLRMVVKTFHSPLSVKKCSIESCPKIRQQIRVVLLRFNFVSEVMYIPDQSVF